MSLCYVYSHERKTPVCSCSDLQISVQRRRFSGVSRPHCLPEVSLEPRSEMGPRRNRAIIPNSVLSLHSGSTTSIVSAPGSPTGPQTLLTPAPGRAHKCTPQISASLCGCVGLDLPGPFSFPFKEFSGLSFSRIKSLL